MFEASCHCGGVTLKANKSPKTVTSCNCSICHRLGSLWAYYSADKVEIANATAICEYSWGEKTMTFHSCGYCGCTTHYTSIRQDGSHKVAISARMASPSSIKDIPVRFFDGADSWKYI